MKHVRLSMALFFVLALAAPAMAQWTDGQNAQWVLGQADFTSSATATSQTGMTVPYGVAVDVTNGKLYVSDGNNHRILRFAYPITGNQPNAEVVLGQADYVSGTANRGGAAAANTLNSPRQLALDSTGRLWVADALNRRILRFDNAHLKATGANADGVLGQPDFVTIGGLVSQNKVQFAPGVAVTSGGILYVADLQGNRVLRFDNAAAKADGANADGVLGQVDFTSSGAATTQIGMDSPIDVAVDGNTLYVSDYNNNRVLRFDNAAAKADGANADGVLGQADFVSGLADRGGALAANTLDQPAGVATDASGRLYVSDSDNYRVVIYDNASGKADGANADNVLGSPDLTTLLAGTTQSLVYRTSGACVDSTNNRLFISDGTDNNRVLQFNASGALPVEMSAFGVE
jgi:sugar lactone lactonase YvrE